MYKTNPVSANTSGSLYVQGILIRASLDEIFNKIIPSQKIDLVSILSSSKTIIWSAEVQLKLASTYYDINNYILIIRTPQIVRLDNMQIYINEIEQRLEYLLKRSNIVLSLLSELLKNTSQESSIILFLLLFFIKVFLNCANDLTIGILSCSVCRKTSFDKRCPIMSSFA